jgi:hypothetical protein
MSGTAAMEKVFLSFTYNPHPDYAKHTKTLELYARRVIEAMGLLPIDGVNLGGGRLDVALKKRIDDCDALVALVTPQARSNGEAGSEPPAFVASEFGYADDKGKQTFQVLLDCEPLRGLVANHEYARCQLPSFEDTILKLMHTLAIWKRSVGRSVRMRCEPRELAKKFNRALGHSCAYQVLDAKHAKAGEWQQTDIFPEPGAAFIHLPNVKDEDLVRVHVQVAAEHWKSDFINPFVGTATLEKE